MIQPTGRTLAVAAALLPLAALPTLAGEPSWWLAWVVAWGVFVAVLLVEFVRLPTRTAVVATVHAPASLGLGDREPVVVELVVARGIAVDLLFDLDGPQAPWPVVRAGCAADERTRVQFELAAERRGVVRLRTLYLAWRGPFGLLRATAAQATGARVVVVPNVAMVRRKALQMLERREFRAGARIERYLGDGSEFEALRDFVAGMDRRSIDWKATARHRKLLSREFRAERDHNVLLCLDTGRLMREPLAGLPRLDHAIHAALQLGYVCLRTGDRVGMHAFAERPRHFLAPQAGMPALQAVQTRVAELTYGLHETNFTLGLTDLLQRLQRRSLVVMFTEFVDPIAAELMLRNLQWLARRHVLVFVALRDPLLGRQAAAAPERLGDVHRAVVAGEMMHDREVVLQRLRQLGAQVVDCGVDELAVDLVDRYLAVKRRELV